jgi:hypothetical protein
MKCLKCPFRDDDSIHCLHDHGGDEEVEDCGSRPPLVREPSLLTKAASLTKAVIGHVADGMKRPLPEVQAERKAICEACPNLDRAGDRCLLCGCHLNAKRAMASERCPEGKWEAV